MNYGAQLTTVRRYGEAIDALQEALAVLSQTSRSVEPLALMCLAEALQGVGRHPEAINSLQKAMARSLEAGGHWETGNAAQASLFLGTIFEEHEQHHQASLSFQQAAELFKKAGNGSRAAEASTSRAPRLAPYLHQRTGGRIGSLSRLIRQAAITAICDGSERITKPLLDTVTLDHLAEEHYRPRRQGRQTSPHP